MRTIGLNFQWKKGLWITPEGVVYEIPAFRHAHWLQENGYPFHSLEACCLGWVRVCIGPYSGFMGKINRLEETLPIILRAIRDFEAEGQVKFLFIHTVTEPNRVVDKDFNWPVTVGDIMRYLERLRCSD